MRGRGNALPPFEEADYARPLRLGEDMGGYELDKFLNSLRGICGVPNGGAEEHQVEDQQ